MPFFCPLIKDICKEEECIAWRGHSICVFFEYFALHFMQIDTENYKDVQIVKPEDPNEQFIALMQSRSAAEWAQEYCAFVKKEGLSTPGARFEQHFFYLFVRTLGFEGKSYPGALGLSFR